MMGRSLLAILKPALISGLLAGALAGGFHFFWTEPLIDRAIAIEQSSKAASTRPPAEPVVARPAQRAGLVLGFLLYGLGWALLLGGLVYLTRSYFPAWSHAKRSFLLASTLGWSVAIFPFLKYPANPPGVGNPDTIGRRQELFLTSMGLAVLGVILVLLLNTYLRRAGRLAWPIGLGIYGAFLVAVFIALPTVSEQSHIPAELIREFRALSLTGHLVFWGSLAGLVGWLAKKE
ncbi:MAG: CbtA family protein [Deltaproteobacteria bacterium]|nr:CbtA family protein [Deltaproteobacteria bacterium]